MCAMLVHFAPLLSSALRSQRCKDGFNVHVPACCMRDLKGMLLAGVVDVEAGGSG